MSKMRIYEYAKNNQMTSKQVIEKLKSLNINVSNHMSTIDQQTIERLNREFSKDKDKDNKEHQQRREQREHKPVQKKSKKEMHAKDRAQNEQKEPVKQQKKQMQPPQQKQQKKHKNKKQAKKAKKDQQVNQQLETPKKITHQGTLTVGELAKKLNKEPSEIIKKLMLLGVMATINQDLDADTIEMIASEYDVEVEVEEVFDISDFRRYDVEDKESDLKPRPPVVTIMGHVDHGKTTLLDAIRQSRITATEAGGITQHIGAYQIEVNGQKITFLDTPGHEAFTTMRARGAQVTDITVLVVAADDGVMPQTVEAINHAKAAQVPIIVAVNKIDKDTANPERVMQELMEHGLVPEDWGGDTIFVPISALKKQGIDDLLEMILLVAEMEELKANPDRFAAGTVIEAKLDKGRGPVATLLVQKGTLKVQDPVVVGTTYGRVRAMVNDLGKRVKQAGPSTPVEITGLHDVPQAGDHFMVFKDEKTARQVADARAEKQRAMELQEKSKVNLDELFEQMKEGEVKELNIIVKADVQGTAEALIGALQKINVEGTKINIIHSGVGAISESDIILASASNAIIIGFNVRPDNNAKKAAETEKVDIRLHRVIYDAIEEIEKALKGMLEPEYEEKVIGQAEVRQTFKVSKLGTIAGCFVTEGKVTRDSGIRLIRDGIVIYEGKVDSLKRFKDDVKEVQSGYECGITLEKFNDIKEGDILEAFVMQEIERT